MYQPPKPIYSPTQLYKSDINDLVEEEVMNKGGKGSGVRGHTTAKQEHNQRWESRARSIMRANPAKGDPSPADMRWWARELENSSMQTPDAKTCMAIVQQEVARMKMSKSSIEEILEDEIISKGGVGSGIKGHHTAEKPGVSTGPSVATPPVAVKKPVVDRQAKIKEKIDRAMSEAKAARGGKDPAKPNVDKLGLNDSQQKIVNLVRNSVGDTGYTTYGEILRNEHFYMDYTSEPKTSEPITREQRIAKIEEETKKKLKTIDALFDKGVLYYDGEFESKRNPDGSIQKEKIVKLNLSDSEVDKVAGKTYWMKPGDRDHVKKSEYVPLTPTSNAVTLYKSNINDLIADLDD